MASLNRPGNSRLKKWTKSELVTVSPGFISSTFLAERRKSVSRALAQSSASMGRAAASALQNTRRSLNTVTPWSKP